MRAGHSSGSSALRRPLYKAGQGPSSILPASAYAALKLGGVTTTAVVRVVSSSLAASSSAPPKENGWRRSLIIDTEKMLLCPKIDVT